MTDPVTMPRLVLVLLLALLTCSQAMAGVVVTGTRLIYPANLKKQHQEITVKLSNNGTRPALVQVWIDSGDPNTTPTNSKAPFVLTPPVARIDPGKGQSLRLKFTGAVPLPQDKESVFWFNALELPPKVEADADSSRLEMAFKTRIKLFYRPDGLPGTADAAIGQVQWKVVPQDQGFALEAHNPSAFYVSLSEVILVDGGRRNHAESGMLAPGETKRLALKVKTPVASGAQVEFKAINDYGASVASTFALKP
jgi:chaperone protein EcpD